MQQLFISESDAFPSYLAADVAAIIPTLVEKQICSIRSSFSVIVERDELKIPYRVYYEEKTLLNVIEYSGLQGQIALCLGTRHHNGFLRQQCLNKIIHINEPWIVPFVLHLVGEYVVEIISDIESAIPTLNVKLYTDFLAENKSLLSKIDRRTISYWGEYYRHAYKDKSEYPGIRVVNFFKQLQYSLTT